MKRILDIVLHFVFCAVIVFAFASRVTAQTTATGQVCYLPDKTKPNSTACYELTPDLLTALAVYVANEKTDTGELRYKGVADLITRNLANGLFQTVITAYPPAAVAAAKSAETAAVEATQAAKDAVLAVPVVIVDPTAPTPKGAKLNTPGVDVPLPAVAAPGIAAPGAPALIDAVPVVPAPAPAPPAGRVPARLVPVFAVSTDPSPDVTLILAVTTAPTPTPTATAAKQE